MSGNDTFIFKRVSGSDIAPHVPDLARLRIEVFREFPYLYDGDEDYERKYLRTYVDSPRSLGVLVYDVAKIFYCGESVLRRDYRGRGVYKHLFQARELHAASLPGIELCTFCGVRRPADHPLRPPGYAPLNEIWQRFGYSERPELETQYVWKDIDADAPTAKTMRFWTKPLHAEAGS